MENGSQHSTQEKIKENFMKKIENDFISLLNSLGYTENKDDVYTLNSFIDNSAIEVYYKKTIQKIKPDLIFCQFNKPFIIFFNKNKCC